MRNTCRIDSKLLEKCKKEKRKHNVKYDTDVSLGAFMDAIVEIGLKKHCEKQL